MITAINGILASQMQNASPLLLDTYTTSTVAYSLRKLTNAYTGSAIRVRRSSDNAEQDIGFVANVLDTASLLSFCLATNGFVTKWYSQIGGSTFDALQATALKQPKIVSAGALNTKNGKASCNFTSTSSQALATSAGVVVMTGQFLSCAVGSTTTIGASSSHFINQDNYGGGTRLAQFITRQINACRVMVWNTLNNTYLATSPTITVNTQYVFNTSKVGVPGTVSSGLNNGIPNSAAFVGTTLSTAVKLSLGSGNAGNAEFLDGEIQEAIIFNGDNSANKTAIITNIKSYYGIV